MFLLNFFSSLGVRGLISLCMILGSFACGYYLGDGYAAQSGEVALSALKAEYAEERQANANAYSLALAESLKKYQGEVARADTLIAGLTVTTMYNKKQSQSVKRQIIHATQNSNHIFSSEFVRLYNEAIGSVAASPVPAAIRAKGPAGKSGTRTAAETGFLQRDAVGIPRLDEQSGVTESDLLAHIAYYGERCRTLESGRSALVTLVEGWK